MDLLNSYGSDAESDDEQQPANAGRADAPASSRPDEPAGHRRAGLFSPLPPPKGKLVGELGETGSSGSLFAALPPPKAPASLQHISDLQSDLGLPGNSVPLPHPKRGVVQFRPPIDTSYLSRNDSEDNDTWVPPKKKERKADSSADGASENKPGKPSFASFLPPPKNSLGAGNVLGGGLAGGRKMVMETVTGLDVTEERPRVVSIGGAPSSGSGPARSGGASGNGGSIQADAAGFNHPPGTTNRGEHQTATPSVNTYRESGPGSGYDQPGAATHFQNELASTSAYAEAQHFAGASATWQPGAPPGGTQTAPPGGATWQSDMAPGGGQAAPPVDLLTAKLMEEEARKRKRGGGRGSVNGPQIVEVKQADIAGGSYRREDMLKNNAASFGPQLQPMSSAKEAGPGKMERRKHQISSLYADMKKKEMEMMDSRASGLQNKTQTKGKYGW